MDGKDKNINNMIIDDMKVIIPRVRCLNEN